MNAGSGKWSKINEGRLDPGERVAANEHVDTWCEFLLTLAVDFPVHDGMFDGEIAFAMFVTDHVRGDGVARERGDAAKIASVHHVAGDFQLLNIENGTSMLVKSAHRCMQPHTGEPGAQTESNSFGGCPAL